MVPIFRKLLKITSAVGTQPPEKEKSRYLSFGVGLQLQAGQTGPGANPALFVVVVLW